MEAMLDSYISRVMVTLVGAASAFIGIAGGAYATYLAVTMIGNS